MRKPIASEHACRRAIAQLLMADPSNVVLRPPQRRISPTALVAGLPGATGEHQALPAHLRVGRGKLDIEDQPLESERCWQQIREEDEAMQTREAM